MKVVSRARGVYAVSLVLCAVLLVALALPAAAAKPAGKSNKGKAHRAETSAVTEDNDTNDGDTPNNVVDDGDNRHPSGRDKSVEHGGSGNQGKSQSDPDGDSNGGVDKPGGDGGADLADQDGNNGCGNDDDFEDDNNGNCGPKVKPVEAETPAAQPDVKETDVRETDVKETDVKETDGDCSAGSGECAPKTRKAPEPEQSCSEDLEQCLGIDEGSCGALAHECRPPATAGSNDTVETPELGSVADEVTGDVLASQAEVEGETAVAGVALERPVGATGAEVAAVGAESGALAATGAPMVVLTLLALGGLGLGTGLVRRSRKS